MSVIHRLRVALRCHDGNHITNTGDGNEEVISVECNLCHTVPIVGRGTEMIVDAPAIVGNVPESHADFKWTIEHRNAHLMPRNRNATTAMANLFATMAPATICLTRKTRHSHTRVTCWQAKGVQVCYTCHQDVTCTRCHPSGIGIVNKP